MKVCSGPVIRAYQNSWMTAGTSVPASLFYTHKSLHVIHGAQMVPNHFGRNLPSDVLTELISDTNHVEMAIHTWGESSVQLMLLIILFVPQNLEKYTKNQPTNHIKCHYREITQERYPAVFSPYIRGAIWGGAENASLGTAFPTRPELLVRLCEKNNPKNQGTKAGKARLAPRGR